MIRRYLLLCALLSLLTGCRSSRLTSLRPGRTRAILIRATLLLPDSVLPHGELLIDTTGRIACVGPDCGHAPAAAGASVINAPRTVVSPGLINAHDHLSFDHLPPLRIPERYTNRQQWRLGLDGHTRIEPAQDSAAARLAWSELRQLLVGTTAVLGRGGSPGLLRNLDSHRDLAPLGGPAVRYTTFPLRDDKGTLLEASCAYPAFNKPPKPAPPGCFVPHVGEGTDAYSRNEFRCLTGQAAGGYNILPDGSTIVHAMALSRPEAQWLHEHRISVVWSPSSNVRLYGQTAPVTRYDSLGVNLLLGTDWTPTGSATLPAEMRYVHRQLPHGDYFSPQQLWQMVTRNAASGLGLRGQLGELAVGQWADVVLYTGTDNPYLAVIDATPARTHLVLRAGQPLYGDARLLRRLPASRRRSEALPAGIGPQKRVVLQSETRRSFPQLRQANQDSYSLTPADQPVVPPAP